MRDGTFAALDCARLPSAVLSAVLFGESSRARQLRGGTRYLREPSLLARELQVPLAAYLKETADHGRARIIAGCSLDPQEEIRAGRLTEAFYCAVSPLLISLPPLRERLADLPGLVERLLERLNGDRERPITGLTSKAWELLRAYAWPGNLRELYEVLQGAGQRTTTERVDANDLPAALRLAVRMEQIPQPVSDRALRLDDILEQAERRLIVSALRKANGNRSRAAELLSIWRPRLLRRMEALGITEW
jgi:DNA-binding NtrC family response regulator